MKQLMFNGCKRYLLSLLLFSLLPNWLLASSTGKKILSSPFSHQLQPVHMLKLDLVSPFWGATSLAYEFRTGAQHSIEAGAGIIGLGFNTRKTETTGFFARAGMKFYLQNQKNRPALSGLYVRPELAAKYLKDMYEFDLILYRHEVYSGALLANMGYQVVFARKLAVDVFAGAGGAFHTERSRAVAFATSYRANQIQNTAYGFADDGNGKIRPAFQFGLRLGYRFGKGC